MPVPKGGEATSDVKDAPTSDVASSCQIDF